jgi:alpha-glucosidase
LIDLYKKEKEKSVIYEDAQDGYDYKRKVRLSFKRLGKKEPLVHPREEKYDKLIINKKKYKANLIGRLLLK